MHDVLLALNDLRRPARTFHARNRTRLVDCGISFAVSGDGYRCPALYPHELRDVANDPREREIAFRARMANFWWRLDLLIAAERAGATSIEIHLEIHLERAA